MDTNVRNRLQMIVAGVVLHATIFAQTQVDLRTQSKSIDFTQASATRPIKTGTTLPVACTGGDLFLDMDASGGANLFACFSGNAWVLQGTTSTITLQSNGTSVGARPIQNLIAGFGLVNMIDDDGTKLNIQQHVDTAVVETKPGEQIGSALLCSSSGGSGSVYTCAMNPMLAQYTTGMVLRWKPDVTVTSGSVTLDVDGLGTKSVKLADGNSDPTEADVIAGGLYSIWYDGTNFRLMGDVPGSSATAASQPLCTTLLRGRIWFVPGAVGIKDGVSVCAKGTADDYAWRTLY